MNFYGYIEVDLHGLNESEAYGPILNALFELKNNPELDRVIFITGIGERVLKNVLETILDDESFNWYQENNNPGKYIVIK
ncbi:hypothetical protein ACW95P_00270 [Candidatus Mycoplasma pogonae]